MRLGYLKTGTGQIYNFFKPSKKPLTLLGNPKFFTQGKNTFFFDLDGVLCDSERISVAAHQFALQSLRQKYKMRWVLPGENQIKAKVNGHTVTDSLANIGKMLPEIDSHRKEYSLLLTEEYQRLKNEGRNTFLIDSSVALFKFLLDQHFTLAIVSGSTQNEIKEVVDLMGIQQEILMLGKENYNRAKPDSEPYLTAAKLLGVPSNKDCIVIEDSLSGIESAKKAGMFVIALSSTCTKEALHAAKADMVVGDLREIIPLITFNHSLKSKL